MADPAGDYHAQADLANALSGDTLIALFDDDRDGVADAGPVQSVIDRAEAQVNSYLLRAYPGLTLPVVQSPLSAVLLQASLMFSIPYSFLRHPEYVRTFGENPRGKTMLEEAHRFMERLCTGKQLLFDVPEQTTPTLVGGVVVSSGPRTMIDGPDGTINGAGF